MSKRFWAVIIVIVLLFVGFVAFRGGKDNSTGSKDKSKTTATSDAGTTNHVRGKNSAGVTLVEYGDFQCPGCYTYFSVNEQVFAKYGDQISFQFRNFPLPNLHPNAFTAARSAEAAGKQNKFWEMYKLIYQNQLSWAPSDNAYATFKGYAQQLGLDMTRFENDYKSAAVNAAINADFAHGQKIGVDATPTYFLNGQKITVEPSLEAFSKLLDAAIAKSGKTTSTPAPTEAPVQ